MITLNEMSYRIEVGVPWSSDGSLLSSSSRGALASWMEGTNVDFDTFKRATTVTIDPWGVSVSSGEGKHVLNVYAYPNGYDGESVRCPECDGKNFPTSDAGFYAAFLHCHLKPYVRERLGEWDRYKVHNIAHKVVKLTHIKH